MSRRNDTNEPKSVGTKMWGGWGGLGQWIAVLDGVVGGEIGDASSESGMGWRSWMFGLLWTVGVGKDSMPEK